MNDIDVSINDCCAYGMYTCTVDMRSYFHVWLAHHEMLLFATQ